MTATAGAHRPRGRPRDGGCILEPNVAGSPDCSTDQAVPVSSRVWSMTLDVVLAVAW